jgi:hypothetical protein
MHQWRSSTPELLTDRYNSVERGTPENDTTEEAWKMSMEGAELVVSSAVDLSSAARADFTGAVPSSRAGPA